MKKDICYSLSVSLLMSTRKIVGKDVEAIKAEERLCECCAVDHLFGDSIFIQATSTNENAKLQPKSPSADWLTFQVRSHNIEFT